MTDSLRISDALHISRESVDEHLRTICMQLDNFPVNASPGEQSVELLNIRRRASLARAALSKGLYFPKVPRLVEPVTMVNGEDLDD